MKSSFSFLAVCAVSLVLILVVISYYLFSKIAATTQSESGDSSKAGADTLRKHGVTDLASKMSYLTADSSIVWPTEWQQIGTADSGCQIQNMHCQITSATCFDLQELAQSKFKLPIDSVEGTAEKTGYALKLTDNKLYIRACYTDSSTAVSQELRL